VPGGGALSGFDGRPSDWDERQGKRRARRHDRMASKFTAAAQPNPAPSSPAGMPKRRMRIDKPSAPSATNAATANSTGRTMTHNRATPAPTPM
jgi:hypothetical protein